ncbi:MAG: hypothetical protein NDI75_10675 [Candidatus Didemnitutus sp.]|nr:hypothetical protein [Candidatus Didemnitutus sp.]
MPNTFRRPVLTSFFYGLAAISVPLSIFVGCYVWYQIRSLSGWMPVGFALLITVASLLSLAFYLALGYGIEKLAQIERNTRPEHQRATAFAPGAATGSAAKSFYVTSSGQTLGPLNAQGLVNLYRDGKLTRSSQILVEENGYRRTVTDWSEFGL